MRGDPEIVDVEPKSKVRVVKLSLWRGQIVTGQRWLMPEIIADVAEAYGLRETDLLGRGKSRKVAIARQHAMWLMRQAPRRSLPQIGQFFGMDHSTVHHGVAAHEARLAARRIETERAA